MKVLNVNPILDPTWGGGTAERTVQMSRFLVKKGMDCTILTLDLGLTTTRRKYLSGINLVALPCINKRFFIPTFSFRLYLKIVKNSDIIHLMGHWSLLNVIIYFFARFLKKPYVICPAGSLGITGRSKILKHLFNSCIGKRILINATSCIAITQDEVSQLMEYGVKKEKIAIIPNGIDKSNYTYRNDKQFREKYHLGDSTIILFMGRLNLIKGPDLLLKAFCRLKKHTDAILVFAGSDEGMLASLKQIAKENRVLKRVYFIGFIDGEEKSQAYHSASMLVVPSRSEAMSIVALEGGICGLPVLLTDQCGFNEIEEINGGRVVNVSVEELKKGLNNLLDNRKELAIKGKNLHLFVKETFVWESIVMQYISLYKNLIKSNNFN